jgi:phage baseplate assembly protein W
MARADRFTIEEKKIEYYSDFLINLDKNPITGFLGKVTNEESIKQSLKSLILTQRTERPFQPWLGSKIYALLFELNSPLVEYSLKEEIKTTIQNCEPRVHIDDIVITSAQAYDTNEINITLYFQIRSIPGKNYTLDVVLNRTR